MRRIAPVVTLTGLLAIACGRSSLDGLDMGAVAGAGAGGTSRNTSVATTGPGGAGGSGGVGGSGEAGGGGSMPLACNSLVVTGAALDTGPTVNPAMFISNADQSRVTIVGYQFMPFGFPIGSSLHHASFEPWGNWPGAMGNGYLTVQHVTSSFVAARATDDTLALLFQTTGSMGVGPSHYTPRVPMAAAGLGLVDLPIPAGSAEPQFMEYVSEVTHVFGRAAPWTPMSPFETLVIGWVVTPAMGAPLLTETQHGCVDDHMVADGMLVPPDKLFFARTGETTHDCPTSVTAGARRWLTVENLNMPQPQLEYYGDQPVEAIDFALGASQVWLSFRRYDGPIELVELSYDAQEVRAPIAITEPGERPWEHAISPFRDGIAVAFVDSAPQMSRLVVRVIDGQGQPLGEMTMPPPAGGILYAGATSRPAILTSPDGNELLVVWGDWNGYDDAPTLGHVVRLACGP